MTALGISFIRACVHRMSLSQEGAAGMKKSVGGDGSSMPIAE